MPEKKCTRCGKIKERSKFYPLKSPKYKDHWDCRDSHCIPCRKIYTKERYWETKRKAVNYLGGECMRCHLKTKYVEVYDFHHRNPENKDFSISKNNLGFNSIRSELDKCDLLCANCHRITHYTPDAYNE